MSATAPSTAAEWIAHLGLTPHPEGGAFRQTYRAAEEIAAEALPARFGAARAHATAIYFLLGRGETSTLHRLRADELWFFHAGGALLVHGIDPGGRLHTRRLGPDVTRGDALQAVVPHGWWFGAEPAAETAYALVSCAVAPGFDFADFELAERATLLARFPAHRGVIERLTPPGSDRASHPA